MNLPIFQDTPLLISMLICVSIAETPLQINFIPTYTKLRAYFLGALCSVTLPDFENAA